MPPAARYRLKLSRLDYISAVDDPAQQSAKVVLLKRRARGVDLGLTADVVKFNDELGLVFCWAFTSQVDGTDYFDLQGDNIDGDFMKVCADFMQNGGLTDEMHDGSPDGKVVFGMPMMPEVAKAFGVDTDTYGFMVALKPSAEVYAKYKAGEYTGVSIAGTGVRETVKAVWSTAMVDKLPDSSFLYVKPGGTKKDGKTEPKGNRMFPYKDASGKIDLPHLRNAAARIPQSSLPSDVKDRLAARAKDLLSSADKRYRKDLGDLAVTSLAAGHQHTVDPDDVDDDGSGRTSFATANGEQYGHSHEWVTDAEGTISILANEGHTHTVDAKIVPSEDRDVDTLAQVELLPIPGIGSEPGAVSARAPRAADLRSGATGPSVARMNELEIARAELAKANAELAKVNQRATLTDAQRTHHAKLSGSDADAYLAKGHAARDAEIADRVAKDPEVYKSKTSGRVFRASDDPAMVEMAKRLDAQDEELAKSRSERDDAAFAKSAGEVLSFTKQDVAVQIVKAVAVFAGTDTKKRDEMLTALGQLTACAKIAGAPQGAGGGPEQFLIPGVGTAEQQFDTARDAYAKAHNLPTASDIERARATSAFIKTSDGAAAFHKYNASKQSIATAHP